MIRLLNSVVDFYKVAAWPISTFIVLTFLYNLDIKNESTLYFFHFFVIVGITITPLNHYFLSSVANTKSVPILILLPFLAILSVLSINILDNDAHSTFLFILLVVTYCVIVNYYTYVVTKHQPKPWFVVIPVFFSVTVISTFTIFGDVALLLSVIVLMLLSLCLTDRGLLRSYLRVFGVVAKLDSKHLNKLLLSFVPVIIFGFDKLIVSNLASQEFYQGYVYYSVLALQPVSFLGALYARRKVQSKKFITTADMIIVIPLIGYVLLALIYSVLLQEGLDFLLVFASILLLGIMDRYWRLRLMYNTNSIGMISAMVLAVTYSVYPASLYLGFLYFGVTEFIVFVACLFGSSSILFYYRAKSRIIEESIR